MERNNYGIKARIELMDRMAAPDFNLQAKGATSRTERILEEMIDEGWSVPDRLVDELDQAGLVDATRIQEQLITHQADERPMEGRRMELKPNPFLAEIDDGADRLADETKELMDRYEQEIQELDESQLLEEGLLKNRVLDRAVPGHARIREEHYQDARDAKTAELGMGLSQLDERPLGWSHRTSAESMESKRTREREEKGLEI